MNSTNDAAFEEERKVWEEVKESMSKRIMELSERINQQEGKLRDCASKELEMQEHAESLEKEKEELRASLESEKRTTEGQIAQILRLNEEVITSIDEKTQLQQRIAELEEETKRLDEATNDPKNYYKVEMQRVSVLIPL